MLSYAENDFGGKDFVSAWTYAADDLTLTDEIALEGALSASSSAWKVPLSS